MMKTTKYTAFVTFTLSLSLVACGLPQTQPTLAPPTNTIQPAIPANPDDYEHALFHVQKYLDALQTKKKLSMTYGIVNPINLTDVAQLTEDELFSLVIKLSKHGEFDVTRNASAANRINIRPLKPDAKATLTLIAGTEKAVVELETLLPGNTPYLESVANQKKLILISGKVNTVDLTPFDNLKPSQTFSLGWKFSKAGEFNLALHPTDANKINLTPLKPDAKAILTLISGNQRTQIELTTITPASLDLGQNIKLVLPQNREIKESGFREVKVEGIAQSQMVWLGWKNANPQAFRVENPKEKPNVLRVTALKANQQTTLTVLAGETRQTVTFTSIPADVPVLLPSVAIQSPRSGTVFNSTEDVKLVAKLENPVVGKCEVLFKDDNGNLLTTSPVATESNAQQVTHLWAAKDRSPVVEKSKFQAVYTCSEPPQEVKSGFVEVSFSTTVAPKAPQTLTVKATPVAGQEYTQMLLEFVPLPDIRDYKVYADERLLGTVTTQLTDKVVSYRAEGLSSGKTYVFKVEAILDGAVTTSGTVNGSTRQSSASGGGNFVPSAAPASTGPPIGINSLSVNNACPGTSIQINGFGFDATAANNKVVFGAVTATVTAATTTQLTVSVPPGNNGAQAIKVTANGNTTTAQSFTINGNILYVDAGAAGANNGTSWANAYTSLTAALTASSGACGDSLWVKAGTYKPGAARTNSFQLKTNVAVYGGFAGTETELTQRNWVNNQTTLSADINADDTYGTTPPGNIADNNYHVVKAVSNSLLDGFIVIGGNADGVAPDNTGGGIQAPVPGANITLRNLVIESNTALSGGGIGSSSGFQGILEHSVLYRNVATTSIGGALSIGAGTTTFNNVLIAENQAPNSRQMATNATTTWNNVTLVNNVSNAGADGKTLIVNSGTLIINNSIIWGNTTGLGCNGIRNGGTTLNILNSVVDNFPANSCSVSSSANIQTVDPSFVNGALAKGADGKFFTTDDGYALTAGSTSALNNGNNALIGAGVFFDITGSTNRIVNVTVDRGAYEKP